MRSASCVSDSCSSASFVLLDRVFDSKSSEANRCTRPEADKSQTWARRDDEVGIETENGVEPVANRPYNAESLQPKRLRLQGLAVSAKRQSARPWPFSFKSGSISRNHLSVRYIHYIRQIWSYFNLLVVEYIYSTAEALAEGARAAQERRRPVAKESTRLIFLIAAGVESVANRKQEVPFRTALSRKLCFRLLWNRESCFCLRLYHSSFNAN
jgi:hypothetical protein